MTEGSEAWAAIDGALLKLEQCAVILERANCDVYAVHRRACEGGFTPAEAGILNHACRVDLREASLMIDACLDMLIEAVREAERSRDGVAALRRGSGRR